MRWYHIDQCTVVSVLRWFGTCAFVCAVSVLNACVCLVYRLGRAEGGGGRKEGGSGGRPFMGPLIPHSGTAWYT
jgi:hypothetical protein